MIFDVCRIRVCFEGNPKQYKSAVLTALDKQRKTKTVQICGPHRYRETGSCEVRCASKSALTDMRVLVRLIC